LARARDAVKSAAPRGRGTGGDRRRELLAAAIGVFAERGYAAPTAVIAQRAGISEAYLYRLFTTKRQLFLACHEAVQRRIWTVLEDAACARGEPSDRRSRMRSAYAASLSADERRFQVHVQTAAADPLILAAARAGRHATLEHISSLGADAPFSARAFYGELMLMNLDDLLDPTPSPNPE
jgi:AcrR family transcriptional regulator